MILVNVTFKINTGPIGSKLFEECSEIVFNGENRTDALISYVLVTDEMIQFLNKQYLQHDSPTDVITFPLEESGTIEAEIVISVETARRQAREYKVSHREEFARLAIHGILHLCGYDDTDSERKKMMSAKEDEYLDQYLKRHRMKT